MMRTIGKKRRMLLALAAPMLLVGACAQVDSESGEGLVVTDDGVDGTVAAVYRTGDDAIEIVTRRIVKDVTEADGVRTTQYIPVAASASAFDIEVTAVDVQREIRLVSDSDGVSFTGKHASLADKERALALFGEAMLALSASDAAIPVAERQVLEQLGDQAATAPVFEAPPGLTPLANYDGCRGRANAPTVSSYSQSVRATATVVCLGDDEEHEMKFEMCIHGNVLESAAQNASDYSYTSTAVSGKIVCQATEKITLDAAWGEGESIEVGANGLCGTERTKYEYWSELNAVSEFNSGWTSWFQGDEDWDKISDTEGSKVDAWCGASPPDPYPNSGGFRPWTPGG